VKQEKIFVCSSIEAVRNDEEQLAGIEMKINDVQLKRDKSEIEKCTNNTNGQRNFAAS